QIMVVDLVTVAVAFGHRCRSVDAIGERARNDFARLGAETHRSSHVGARRALLDRAIAILPFGDQRDHRMRRRWLEFGAVGIREARLVPRIFDDGKLHAETDAKIRHAILARVAYRRDLAFDAALAESARHEDRIDTGEAFHALALDGFGIDVMDLHPAARVYPGVGHRFGQRLVRFGQVDILADHRDPDRAFGVLETINQSRPRRQVRGGRLYLE